MTDLIKANRDLFRNLIVNEELSSMNFLTVVHDTSSKVNCSGDTFVVPGMTDQMQLDILVPLPSMIA